jgi:hypothetical protein
MQRSIQHITAKKLFQMVTSGKADFSLNVQRKLVWDKKRKSLFIDSLMYDMPVPLFFAVKDNEKLHFLDGQQRANAVVEFLTDQFELSSNITNEELVGKKFSKLPGEIIDAIEDYSFMVCQLAANGEAEIEEVFNRLNNGVGLSPFEITRSKAGRNVVDLLEELTRLPIFQNLNLNAMQRRRYADEEVALQAMGLLYCGLTDLRAPSVRKMVISLRKSGIPDEIRRKMVSLTTYLSSAPFPIDDKGTSRALRKSNVPMLYYLAARMQLPPGEFARKVVDFFRAPTERYRSASVAQSSGSRHIKTKIEELNTYFGLIEAE